MGGELAQMGETRGAFGFLVRKFEGQRSRERHRRRWKNNIKKDLREIEWNVVNSD
jgi:hypothetical protein